MALGNVVPLREVWTGTGPAGMLIEEGTCNDWTPSSGSGFLGVVGWNAATNDDWTEVFVQFCDRDNISLYCIQQ